MAQIQTKQAFVRHSIAHSSAGDKGIIWCMGFSFKIFLGEKKGRDRRNKIQDLNSCETGRFIMPFSLLLCLFETFLNKIILRFHLMVFNCVLISIYDLNQMKTNSILLNRRRALIGLCNSSTQSQKYREYLEDSFSLSLFLLCSFLYITPSADTNLSRWWGRELLTHRWKAPTLRLGGLRSSYPLEGI